MNENDLNNQNEDNNYNSLSKKYSQSGVILKNSNKSQLKNESFLLANQKKKSSNQQTQIKNQLQPSSLQQIDENNTQQKEDSIINNQEEINSLQEEDDDANQEENLVESVIIELFNSIILKKKEVSKFVNDQNIFYVPIIDKLQVFVQNYKDIFKNMSQDMNIDQFDLIQYINISNKNDIVFQLLKSYQLFIVSYQAVQLKDYIRMIQILCGGQYNIFELQNNIQKKFETKDLNILKERIDKDSLETLIYSIFKIILTQSGLRKEAETALQYLLSKAANESQIKLASMAQSVQELTEDDFPEAFN